MFASPLLSTSGNESVAAKKRSGNIAGRSLKLEGNVLLKSWEQKFWTIERGV
jgi:hypothetical protein